jgi:hypothetical protein
LPKGGLTPLSQRLWGENLGALCGGGHCGASCELGNRIDWSGARNVKSVAEVGERRLPIAVKVSREASQEGEG